MTKPATLPPRPSLSEAQEVLLKNRLQQARTATSTPHVAIPAIPRRKIRGNLPLSSAQQRLWFLDQLEPGSPVYNICEPMRMRGALNVSALKRSLNDIIRRHETLRTHFMAIDGTPMQVIADERPLSLVVHDIVVLQPAAREERLAEMMEEEARCPFDLSTGPLLRVLLVRVEPEDHVLMFTLHHIISDGWSQSVFAEELAAFYEAALAGRDADLPPLPLQYGDFALWEQEQSQSGAHTRPLEYWKKRLCGPLPVLELPTDHPRGLSPLPRCGTKTLELPSELAGKLRALSQNEGATLFMTLLAAFMTLLHRYTGEDDIVVGSVVRGRPQVALEKLIGFFVNTLVLRENLGGDPTFRELLARTRETTFDALAHQDLPFTKLVEALHPDRSPTSNPLFQVMLVLQEMPTHPMRMPGLVIEPMDVRSVAAKFDLLLFMIESPGGLTAMMEYNADLFEAPTISRLLGHLQVLLEGIVEDPDRDLSRLPLLTHGERRDLLVERNRTETPYPREKTIDQLFAEQVRFAPNAIALACGGERLTYAQLDERAERLARRLTNLGVGADTLVGVCLERSVEMIVALVAIMKAGGAYVAFDPGAPIGRLGFMLFETKAPVLITVSSRAGSVTEMLEAARTAGALQPPAVIMMDVISPETDEQAPRSHTAAHTPENLAYVSYTSGSTGTPKGVCVPHRGVVRLVKETNFARFDRDDVFLQLASVSFDASTLEIWGPLLNGGRLVVCPPGQLSLTDLGECIRDNGVTVLWLTAGLFHQMVEEHLCYLKNVRVLLAGGDVLSVPLVARTLAELPRTRLINGYGPTENTTFTCCHLVENVTAATRSVSIGRPIANTRVYILDAHLQPVPVGVPGELFAGGDGLARGYLQRPDLTREKFITHNVDGDTAVRLYKTGDRVRWLADGTIEFMGRMDRQVKIRGYRVEPAETEAALLTHPAVKNGAVLVAKDASGEKRLVACVVVKEPPPPSSAELDDYLRLRLPDYMVPSSFVVLEALPLSPNGKVDCAALLRSAFERPDTTVLHVPPRDELERKLAGIWEDVLGVKEIGIHDRFFKLGGHSLLAVRLLAKIEKTFDKKLPVSAVFQHPTVAQLAGLIRSGSPAEHPAHRSLIDIQPHGTRPPIYFVHGIGGGMFWGYANLSRHLGPDQPVRAFKSCGIDGHPEWPTIPEIARSYVADLKSTQPEGPYVLGGYCFGGNVAYEMARQLKEQGDDVALVVLISASPPNSPYEMTSFNGSPSWMLKFCRNTGLWLTSFVLRWDAAERRNFVRWKLRRLQKKFTALLSRDCASAETDADMDQLIDLAAVGDEQRRLWDAHMRALILHQPRPYDGKVVLFRSAEHLFVCSFDENCGWDQLTPDFTLKIVPGDHGRVLEEPYVGAVADEIRKSLDAVLTSNRKEALV